MKFLWYNRSVVREYVQHKRKNNSVTEHDLGSERYKNLYRLNTCFSDSPWGLQHDITGNVPHHFNIVTRTPYVYREMHKSFEEVCIDAAKKISSSTDKLIAVLWSGGIDSTAALVSLLQVVPHDRIVVVCNSFGIKEYPGFYEDIIKDKLTTISVQQWAASRDKYFTTSGDGGDAVWAVIDDDAWNNRSDIFNQPWKKVLDKSVAPKFEFIEEFASWSGVDIKTWLDLRAWFYVCCKWQDKCTRLYSLKSDLSPANACPFYDIDNSFQLWTMHNLDKIIDGAWHKYKMPAKEMIYRYHADKEYLDTKSKVESEGLTTKIQHLDTPMRFVLPEDYSNHTLTSWPFLDMYEFENFNKQHKLIPLDILEN